MIHTYTLNGLQLQTGDILCLAADPVPQVGINQGFQVFMVEFMVVHQSGKAVVQAVPDMPDEGAVVE